MIGTANVRRVTRSMASGGTAALLSLGLLIATVPAVLASGPVHTQDTLQWPGGVLIACEGFDVVSTSEDLQRNIVTWYDANGDIVQQTRRVHFDFTFTNSETGRTAEYLGHFIVSLDNEAGTLSLIGAHSQIWVDGQPVVRVAGRTTFSETGAIFHGHEPEEFEAAVCAAMA